MKIMIVDDEPIIIRGLKLTVPWKDYGIEIIDEASDGKEALEKFRSHKNVDVILTDIRMPYMDGLELVRRLLEESRPPKVILLSGHDDFKYAQHALRLGVDDYLLKPVDIDELIRTVVKVKNEIEEEQQNQHQVKQLKIEALLSHLIIGTPLDSSNQVTNADSLLVYPLLISMQSYSDIVSSMTEEEVSSLKDTIKEKVDMLLNHGGMQSTSLYFEDNILFTCIYEWGDSTPAEMNISIRLEGLKELGLSFRFVFADVMTNIHNISQLYPSMKLTLQKVMIEDRLSLVHYDKETIKTAPTSTSYDDYKEIYKDLLFNKKLEETYKVTVQLFREIKEERFLLEEVFQKLQRIIMGIINHLQTVRVNHKISNLPLNYLKPIDVYVFNSYDSLQELFEQDIKTLYGFINPQGIENRNWLMDRAIQYIYDYYSSEIKASEVADYINISPNYFSSLFKQHTGQSFNEYINNYRIERAKVLLSETADTVASIASQVGYQEYKYFVKIFKQLTKMTPTEYRKFVEFK